MINYGNHTHKTEIDCYSGVEVTIGNFTSIASGLKIYSGKHAPIEHPKVVSTFPFFENWGSNYPPSRMGGKVTIGNDVWIGTDVRILEGVKIGNGAIIGAGTMVARDVPDYAFVVGNPNRIVSYRFPKEIVESLVKIAWWNWSDEKIKEAMPFMQNIEEFIKKYENNT